VIVGREAVIGNSSEIKNSVIFDLAALPHFNYCGDSIIGYRAHLAAGVITSNLKLDRAPVTPAYAADKCEKTPKKLGALVGDFTEIGCGAVLAPGCVIGRGAAVYPLCFVRGYVPENSIMKSNTQTVPRCDGMTTECHKYASAENPSAK
jgi:NDP-sugar pyrophosphorylase family protein